MARLADLDLAVDPAGAGLEVILIRRAESLRHVPGLSRLCRGRCLEEPVTVFHRPSRRGLRKMVVVDIAAIGGADGLDRGEGLADVAAICAEAIVRAEWAHVRSDPPDCATSRRAILSVPGF